MKTIQHPSPGSPGPQPHGRRLAGALGGGLIAAALLALPAAEGQVKEFTLDGDFDQGTLLNLNHDAPNSDQLQLNVEITGFNVLWIANAGEDTVSKIDTSTNKEVARYHTWVVRPVTPTNAFTRAAPSRTAVDGDGNVYVANRHFSFGQPGSVMKILASGGIDRNSNSVIDTSSDLNGNGLIGYGTSEMVPPVDANSNGILENSELADERIAWVSQIPGTGGQLARSLSIAPDGDLWVGLYNGQVYYELDSNTGAVKDGPFATPGHNPYGSLIDSSGTLWSASLQNSLYKMDTNDGPGKGTGQIYTHLGSSYGIALGNGRIYQALRGAGSGRVVSVFDPGTSTFSYLTASGFTDVLGISVDAGSDILLSASSISGNRRGATKMAPDGTILWASGVQPGATSGDQRGAIPDGSNDVWTVNKNNKRVSKYRGSDGAHLGTVEVGWQPYTYSDASGSSFLQANPTGNWTVVCDTEDPGADGCTVSWNASVPAGTSLTVEVRAAATEAGLAAENFVVVANGGAVPPGQFVEVKVTLKKDSADLESPVLFDLTLTCNQAPVAECNDIEVETLPGECFAEVPADVLSDGSFDPEGDAITVSVAPPGPYPTGTTVVTVTVTDAGGRSSSCQAVVTVVDNEAPVIGAADVSAQSTPGECGAAVGYTVDASDNCPGLTVVCDPPSGSVFPVGATVVTCTATDASGNSASASFTVTVEDNEAPTVSCPADIVVANDPGACEAVVSFQAGANDNCPGVTVVCDPPSGSAFPVGTTVVTCIALDASGNTATCEFTVTVNDTEAPTVAAAADITAGNDPGECAAVVSFDPPAAADNCGVVSLVCAPASGSVFPVGATVVTCTATDAAGNTASTSFTVTVEDTEAPTIACPADAVLECPADTSMAANGEATADDNCGVIDIFHIDDVVPGCGNTVTVLRTWVAVDAAGNVAECTQTIEEVDTTPPEITADTHDITPPDAPITFTVSTSDACGAVTLAPLTVTCHKVTKKGKIVDKSDSCVIEINGNQVTVADSGGVGDIITIFATATDACGNTTDGEFVVNVTNPGNGGGGGNGGGNGGGSTANEGVGNGVDGNTPGHDNNGGNDDPGQTPGNPGAKGKKK